MRPQCELGLGRHVDGPVPTPAGHRVTQARPELGLGCWRQAGREGQAAQEGAHPPSRKCPVSPPGPGQTQPLKVTGSCPECGGPTGIACSTRPEEGTQAAQPLLPLPPLCSRHTRQAPLASGHPTGPPSHTSRLHSSHLLPLGCLGTTFFCPLFH